MLKNQKRQQSSFTKNAHHRKLLFFVFNLTSNIYYLLSFLFPKPVLKKVFREGGEKEERRRR
jgi:hypothetical protein